MRQCQSGTTRLGFVFFEVLVQIQRICAADRRLCRERHDLPGLVGIVTENHVPVQVVARDQRGPLEAD